MSEVIKERLKKLMEEKRYSKAELSERLEIGYSTLWRRLNGERGINIDFLLELAKVLDTSVSYLIGETENPERSMGAEMAETHLQQQKTQAEQKTANFSYWGGVVDEAHKVAERGNATEIVYIEPLLRLAYDTIASEREKLEHEDCTLSPESTVVAQMPVFGGHHNKNSLTVGATA